jgi:hypothetical protein
MSPKLHIDLVNDTITNAGDRDKIFSTNTLAVLRLAESAPRLAPELLSLHARDRTPPDEHFFAQ